MDQIKGFSKLTKAEKLDWLSEQISKKGNLTVGEVLTEIKSFWHSSESTQSVFDEFSENTLTNYYLPFGLAPNFIINDRNYAVPMVIEESSVVAAASKAAKFWSTRGGFKSEILGTTKSGQVHMFWYGIPSKLEKLFQENKYKLVEATSDITKNMEKRGGGLLDIKLVNLTQKLEGYFQLDIKFETCDAMGANFINSCLEAIGSTFQDLVESSFTGEDRELEINMCILSNFTPECRVKVWVDCSLEDLDNVEPGVNGREFAEKFKRAIDITKIDPYRATTHNKGIFNGIDSVILATGNDFRAIEACGHAYACTQNGSYQGLSDVQIIRGRFIFSMTIPLALGTVGGLTNLHPLAKLSLEILDNPSAPELMAIVASVGLAQNFAAVKSLTTTGIQKGHMKMHLLNILNGMNATKDEIETAKEYFRTRIVSVSAVRDCLESLRSSASVESNQKPITSEEASQTL